VLLLLFQLLELKISELNSRDDMDAEETLHNIRCSTVVRKFDEDDLAETVKINDSSASLFSSFFGRSFREFGESSSQDNSQNTSHTADAELTDATEDIHPIAPKDKTGQEICHTEKDSDETSVSDSEKTPPCLPCVEESLASESASPTCSRIQLFQRRLSSSFNLRMSTTSLSSLGNSNHSGSRESRALKEKRRQQRLYCRDCTLCHKAFEKGEDVVESTNPRCIHMFHQDCIASWLPYQNTCPTCSETFVVLADEKV